MIKPAEQHNNFLLLLLAGFSLLMWCFLFRYLLNGSTPLQGDADTYFGHIQFYMENITQGVYPLWNPSEKFYNINEFFLRRIGEFNPFFWTIAFLNKFGLSFIVAYRFFLVGYYFLGVAGFYLLCQKLFSDHLASFTAALLMLFSCLGAGIFESFLLLEFVPFIWFSYFLVAFKKAPCKVFLLGAIFTLMIINITYIPFYFYSVLIIFLIYFFIVYFSLISVTHRAVDGFIRQNKIFTYFCIALLMISFIPGLLWYLQTRQPDISMMQRHIGSQDINPATVSIDKINEGGILPNFIFDRQFVYLDRIGLHDFYIPLFAFLMLFAGLWGRLNKRLNIFFIFGFTIFLIGLADASFIHKYLYAYIPIFKYFRNVQFFLQFAILPVFILFVVEQMQVFNEECKRKEINRIWMTLWVVLVHACAAGLFLYNQVVGVTYIVIILNLAWMLGRIWSVGSLRVWILLLWGAIIIQPFEVYGHIALDYLPSFQSPYTQYDISLPTVQDTVKMMNIYKFSKKNSYLQELPYFATHWVYEALGSVDIEILDNYLKAPFIAYDRVERVNGKVDLSRLKESLCSFKNVAFVHSNTVPLVENPILPNARIMTSADEDFKILKFNSNDVVVRTFFSAPNFLVRTQFYHDQWKASIDRKPVPLYRTNICVQGLWVPAGEHVVRWYFGTRARYVLAYFLLVLYPLVLAWIIWLCLKKFTKK